MSPRRRDGSLGAGLTLLLSLAPAVLRGQGVYLEGGLSFSTGDYTYAERTNAGAAALGVAWSSDRIAVRATVPWFVREAASPSPTGAGTAVDEPSLVPGAGRYTGSVGDPFLQLYVGAVRTIRTSVSLGFSTKVPVLAPGDFGTGGWDFGGSVSVSRSIGTTTLLGFDGSYWHLADPPDLEIQDTVMGTATVARTLGPRWNASLSLSGSRSAVPGYADPWWCGVLLGRSFSRGIWGLTVTIGLTETAPDVGMGFLWRLRVP